MAGPDACTGSGTATITCSGNQSDGIVVGSSGFNANNANTLLVDDLTQPINAAGAGIDWDVNSSNTQGTIVVKFSGVPQTVTGNAGAGVRLTSSGKFRDIELYPLFSTTSLGGTDGALSISGTGPNGSGGSGDGGSGGGGTDGVFGFVSLPIEEAGMVVQSRGASNPAIKVFSQGGVRRRGGDRGRPLRECRQRRCRRRRRRG